MNKGFVAIVVSLALVLPAVAHADAPDHAPNEPTRDQPVTISQPVDQPASVDNNTEEDTTVVWTCDNITDRFARGLLGCKSLLFDN